MTGLRERELEQLLVGRIVVEGPGHREPVRPVDLRILAAGADLRAIRFLHHDPDLPSDLQINLGLRRLPVRGAVEPAPQHLGAGPGVEHDLPGGVEGPLDAHDVARRLDHLLFARSSRYPPTTSKRRSQRVRWLSSHSAVSARVSGRSAWRCVRPSITRVTTPASSSIFGCREMLGFDTPRSRLASPTVAAPPLRRSTISRRVGCASAANASLAISLT